MNIDIDVVNTRVAQNIKLLQEAFSDEEFGTLTQEDGQEIWIMGETRAIEEFVKTMVPVLLSDEEDAGVNIEMKLRALDCACSMLAICIADENQDLPATIVVPSTKEKGEEDEEEESEPLVIDAQGFAAYILRNYQEQLKILKMVSYSVDAAISSPGKKKHKM